MDGIGEIGKVKGKQFRVAQAQHRRADGLGQCPAIREVSITKMCIPVKVIVYRVVNTAAVFAKEAQVQRGDAQMIDKDRVV